MKLFRFLAYCLAFLLGTVFAFRGANSFPAPPPKQYRPQFVVRTAEKAQPPSLPAGNNALVEAGKELFMRNCAMCHNRNMADNLTGPALGGVRQRWSDYPPEDLYGWIRNSQKMISDQHPRAVKLWRDWNQTIMNGFPDLSDEEIDAVLAYIDAVRAW